MEWSKLKNMILIILAATDLFLLAFVVQRELQNSQFQRQAREDAIRFLSDRGVQVSEEQIPSRMELLPQRAERNLETERTLAVRLFGEDVQMEDRGGGVYRYFNVNGSIQFHSDGAFSAHFSAGNFPVGEDQIAYCQRLLARLDFDAELVGETETRLTFRQLWENRPLFTQQVTMEISGGCLTAITAGRRLLGAPTPEPSEPITVPTALIAFLNGVNLLGDVCNRIDSITPGYVASVTLSGPMTLTPVWRIATDTGSYQLDVMSAELSRVA